MVVTNTLTTVTAQCDKCGKPATTYWRAVLMHQSTDPEGSPVDSAATELDLCESCCQPIEDAFATNVPDLLSGDLKASKKS
jgi:hypothetical protein